MVHASWMHWQARMSDTTPAGSAFVVRAPVMLALRDADAIRAAAVEAAARLHSKATVEANALRQSALARGVAEAAAVLAAASVTANDFLTAREAELVDLAFAIAHRLITDLPRDTRTLALVRTALSEHRDGSRLTLRAPTATAPILRAALANTGVEVREDALLGPDECVLLHPGGRAELGPLQQLRALMVAGADLEATG